MSKEIFHLKYFKKTMIVVALFWSLMTIVFFIYQVENENIHLKNNTISKIKNLANESKALVYWAYAQKVREMHMHKNSNNNAKPGFSIRDMLNNAMKNEKIKYDINLNFDEDDLSELSKNIADVIRNMQNTQKDQYTIYKNNNKKYIFYTTALIANRNCISCHIHSEDNIGSVIGGITFKKDIPIFQNENPKIFYFLIFSYSLTWLIGILGIYLIYKRGMKAFNDNLKNFENSIYRLVNMVEKRDAYTAGHSKRVAVYAKLIAEKMWCNTKDIDFVYKAGILHDIGKIEIPDALLLKPEKLNELEYSLIQRHPETGYNLLNKKPFKELAEIVLYHHERYDGKGYPKGLKSKEIPLLSRIIAIADAFDAMTTNRSYREALSVEEAVEIICREKGKQFDPKIVNVAKDILLSQKPPVGISQLPKDKFEEFKFYYYLKDQLTGLYNMNYVAFLLTHVSKNDNIFVNHISLSNFAEYNKKMGWRGGDELLKNFANKLLEYFSEEKVVRFAGDHFLVISYKDYIKFDCDDFKKKFNLKYIDIKCKHFIIEKGKKITLEKFEEYIR